MKKTLSKSGARKRRSSRSGGSGISDREIDGLMHECFLQKELDDLGAPTEANGSKLSAFGRLRRIAPVMLADKARLDWLATGDTYGKLQSVRVELPTAGFPTAKANDCIRAAIDAAMGRGSPNTEMTGGTSVAKGARNERP